MGQRTRGAILLFFCGLDVLFAEPRDGFFGVALSLPLTPVTVGVQSTFDSGLSTRLPSTAESWNAAASGKTLEPPLVILSFQATTL